MNHAQRALAGVVLLCFTITAPVCAQQAADHQVQIFGQKIHYLEAGSGAPVILLHGLGGDATAWAQTVPALAAHYRVYALDQIGFGKSDKPMVNYRIATLVDFLDEFCNQLGIAKASVVGNSLGGWVALGFVLAHPEKVDRLVLVDSAGYSAVRGGGEKSDRERLQTLNPSTLEGSRQLMKRIFYHQELITDASAQRFFISRLQKNDGYTIERFIDSILRGEDVIDGKLGAVKSPTLIVWGREDALINVATAKQFNEQIAGSKLVVLDGCGHVPQGECAAAFNQALVSFLSVSK